jgi:uncharacterized repeat protein (TIGR02543 family)
MVFYAQWIDGSTPQYTVTFNANGATGGAPPAPQTVYRGVSISLPGQGTLSFAGKTFDGWNSAANGAGANYTVGASFTVNAHVTLYAKWRSAVQYTVTYHANGAEGGTAPAAQTVDPGAEITLPGAGSLNFSDRTFDGWNTNAGGTGAAYAEGASYTVNANATLYAQWISTPIVPEGSTLAQKLAYIAGRADDGTVYDILIDQNEYPNPQAVSTQGRNVTVNLQSANASDIKTIQIYSTGTLLTVGSNITLVLENIIIRGSAFNTSQTVVVGSGGTLVLNTGASITGNTMTTSNASTGGGGLWVNGGILDMNDGEISGNESRSNGGGVLVSNHGQFNMKGGRIVNNEAKTAAGGGFFVTGGSSLTMTGGTIAGNKANTWAGGVFCETDSTFRKIAVGGSSTSGVIYGSTEGDNANTATSGAAVHCRSKARSRTLGQYDEISNLNLNVGWE